MMKRARLISIAAIALLTLLAGCGKSGTSSGGNDPSKAITRYTVTFDSNGGSLVNPQKVVKGEMATQPSPDPTKEGHVFYGWYTDDTFVNMWDFATHAVNADITLYAGWMSESDAGFTITFDSNGGSNVPPQTITAGGKATEPPAPVKAGYNFVGWFTDNNTFEYRWDFAIRTVASNIILYAKWELITYAVSFNSNGGSTVATQTVAEGSKVDEPTAPVRAGYTFVGWFTDNDTFAYKWDFGAQAIIANITLYAKWNPLPTFTITFNSNGGSTVAIQTVAEGGKATEPAPIPTKTEYSFGGWFTDNNTFDNKWDFGTQIVTTNVILYAKWDPTYTVTFNSNGGSAVGSQILNYGATLAYPTAPTKADYTFAGWFIDNDVFVNPVIFPYTVISNVTLYAKWGGQADLLYFDTAGTLRVGKWTNMSATDRSNLAFFKFGSVIGFTGVVTDWSASEVKFNTTGATTYGTYDNIPYWADADWNAGIRNVSTLNGAYVYHTGNNVKLGKGDPCRLVGKKGLEIQTMTAAQIDVYKSGWRLPTNNENIDFVGAPIAWYDDSTNWYWLENSNVAYWGDTGNGGQLGGQNGGWFPIPGDRNSITDRTSRNTDPTGFLPAIGSRSASSGRLFYFGSSGYWSATPLSAVYGYGLYLSNTDVKPSIYSGCDYGCPVRCVEEQ